MNGSCKPRFGPNEELGGLIHLSFSSNANAQGDMAGSEAGLDAVSPSHMPGEPDGEAATQQAAFLSRLPPPARRSRPFAWWVPMIGFPPQDGLGALCGV
jgi:hypothetical protein